jgi:hypothetical protein
MAVSMQPTFSLTRGRLLIAPKTESPLRVAMPEAGTIEDEVRRVLEQGRILTEEMIAIQKEADERTERARRRARAAIERRARLRKRLEEA